MEASPTITNSSVKEQDGGHPKELKEGPVDGGGDAVGHHLAWKENEKAAMELIQSIKRVGVKKGSRNGSGNRKPELISMLEETRRKTTVQRRDDRREAWKKEKDKEAAKRVEFRRKMDTLPVEQITEWKDKQSMSKQSLEWRERFKGDRVSFLFHEIFPILHRRPQIHQTALVDTEDILTSRTVSKEWKSAIESRLIDEVTLWNWKYYQRDLSPKKKPMPERELPWCFHKFIECSKVERFNSWSQNIYPGDNPFFSRKLEIGSGLSSVYWKHNLSYWREVEVLLRRWGEMIWQVNIQFDKEMSPELMYEQLVKYLRLMPNLRSLGVYAHELDVDSATTLLIEAMQSRSRVLYEPLKNRIERNPLPELPQLKHLSGDAFVPYPIIRGALAKYGASLESAAVKGLDPEELMAGSSFPVLKWLTSFGDVSRAVNTGLDCPALEKAWVNYDYVEGDTDFRKIFGNVNKFGSKMKWFTMCLSCKKEEDLPDDLFLELPEVETLMLSFRRINPKTIDFLLPCVSMKELNIAYQRILPVMKKKGDPASHPVEIIQFTKFAERLYDSNIWKLFPELKKVSVGLITLFRKAGTGGPRGYKYDTVKPLRTTETEEGESESDLVKVDYTREGYELHCRKFQEQEVKDSRRN